MNIFNELEKVDKVVKIIVTNGHRSLNTCSFRVLNEAKYLQTRGYDTEIIILQNKEIGKKIISNKIDGICIKHYICRSKQMNQALEKNSLIRNFKVLIYFMWFMQFSVWLRKYGKNTKVDFWQCHNLTSVVAGWIARNRSKLIFVMRENYEDQAGITNKFKRFFIKNINEFMQNKSNWLIHVTPQQINKTTHQNKHKVIYIPNYSSIGQYTHIEKSFSDYLRINYIGSVRDYKSLKMLMNASKDMEGIQIGIHGLGEAYLKLKSEESLYENTKITGYYDYKSETEKLYQNTDVIFCVYDIAIQNWRESRPIKFYESMLTITPFISCYEMSVSELIIKYDVGFLFHYDNLDELKELVSALVENPEILEEKKKNIAKIRDNFTWESVVKRFDIIYEGH